MSGKIRNCDLGTEYAGVLIAAEKVGAAQATDPQLMALFCEYDLQILVGTYSPRLVWEGAQKAGLITLQLNELCARKDLRTLDDLQFS